VVRVLILGSTGMLGNTVGKWFLSNPDKYEVHLTYRTEDVSYGENKHYFNAVEDSLEDLPNVDWVINCIGTIKPFMTKDPVRSIEINSLFPWKLARFCEDKGTKLIHITTDCVYSGASGLYTEDVAHDALDDYGKSKSLGEPDNCMVLRTSIIGEEIHKDASLISWVKSQKGKKVNGFTNHQWNGITTKQYAKICDQIVSRSMYKVGKYHVFSPYSVNKHELVTMLGEKFDLELTVKKTNATTSADRTLASNHSLCKRLEVPSIKQQIKEL
jgi:dTDP-4-dehydrorhamnose reductase